MLKRQRAEVIDTSEELTDETDLQVITLPSRQRSRFTFLRGDAEPDDFAERALEEISQFMERKQ